MATSEYGNNANMNEKPSICLEQAALRCEIARFRADLAISSPQSYSVEEMRAISAEVDASEAAARAAMRAEFCSLPPQAQALMLDLIEDADPENMTYWNKLLGLEMPSSPRKMTHLPQRLRRANEPNR